MNNKTNIQKFLNCTKSHQYAISQLSESDLDPDPIKQFYEWFLYAQKMSPDDIEMTPESFTLSSANKETGEVSSRTVLLKEINQLGIVFFSNLKTSKKSQDFKTNKLVAATFYWPYVQRQVNIRGKIEYMTKEESFEYFKTRLRGSKIGAWASSQSEEIPSKKYLDDKVLDIKKKFESLIDDKIPCPDYWGGMVIVPFHIEFWQGRVNRLHDRILYKKENNSWVINRLSP